MYKEFRIDGLIYEFCIAYDNSVRLGITGGASPRFRPEADPFDWHAPAYVIGDEATSRYPLRVARQVIALLHEWIGSQRPKHFSFSASTKRRLPLYERVAQQTAARFGYGWHCHDDRFYFYKHDR